MALLSTLTLDDQQDGTAVTVTAPWSTTGTAPTATTGAAVHGPLGAHFSTGTFGVIDREGLSPSDPVVLDFYFTPRASTATVTIGNMRVSKTSSAQLRWNTDGSLTIRDGTTAVATTTAKMTTGQPYRLAWRTSNIGTQELRVYAGESTTPLDTISGTITSSAITEARVGMVAASAGAVFDVDTIRVADDWLGPFAPPPAALHTHFTVRSGSLVPLRVTPATGDPDPPAARPVVVFSASQGGTGSNVWTAFLDLDGQLAAAAGTTAPFSAGRHSYSGNAFPATFAQTNSAQDHAAGYSHSVLNVKCPWDQLADGRLDAHLTGFIDSIPTGHVVYLIINHEPENDGNPLGAATWCTGQARAANIVATLDDPRCHLAVCHMAFTWVPGSGRNPQDWNPATGGSITMTQAALDRTIFAPDGYTKIRSADGSTWDTMASVFDVVFASARSWGFTRLAISEHALNNDVAAPAQAVADIWTGSLFPWIDAQGLVYYAGYSSEGPAAGTNARLDTPEEVNAFASWVAAQRGTGW